MALNQICVMGRLTRDPELRYTQSQLPVCSFTVAVDRDTKNADGTRGTDFFDCVAWRKTAEFVSQYFKKGSMGVIVGRMGSRDWTDKEGQKRRSWEITVGACYFGESKRQSDEDRYAETERQGRFSAAQTPVNVPYSELSDIDGELPF